MIKESITPREWARILAVFTATRIFLEEVEEYSEEDRQLDREIEQKLFSILDWMRKKY